MLQLNQTALKIPGMVQRKPDLTDLANGVVATGKVVGGILLARDQLLRVEQLTVGASADLIHDSGLKVQEDGTWHVLASTSLREEGVEGIITTANGLVRGHLAIRLDAVLQAVELPAGIADLYIHKVSKIMSGFEHGHVLRTVAIGSSLQLNVTGRQAGRLLGV
jgi:hypothetical protein